MVIVAVQFTPNRATRYATRLCDVPAGSARPVDEVYWFADSELTIEQGDDRAIEPKDMSHLPHKLGDAVGVQTEWGVEPVTIRAIIRWVWGDVDYLLPEGRVSSDDLVPVDDVDIENAIN